jgi:hypothetical protein
MAASGRTLIVVASIAGLMLWIERSHRIDTETRTQAEIAGNASPACPANEDLPHSADCLTFLLGHAAPDIRGRANAAPRAPTAVVEVDAPCSGDNDDAPYSARCLSFMSDWFWPAMPADKAR